MLQKEQKIKDILNTNQVVSVHLTDSFLWIKLENSNVIYIDIAQYLDRNDNPASELQVEIE